MNRIIFSLLLVFCVHLPLGFCQSSQPHEASFYQKLKDNLVQCLLCPRGCVIAQGKRGYCGVRENKEGKLYSLSYGQVVSANIDPIEKKPLFHFLPATQAFSIATAGCNLKCKFCQNWEISQKTPEQLRSAYLSPQELVDKVKASGAPSIAYTYTEPTIFYEYMLETAKLARSQGIRNVMHSNGYINEKPLRELAQYMDAANIDLKGFSDEYYTKLAEGSLQPVLRSLKVLKEAGVHVEITNLILPGYNDDPQTIQKMCQWIKDNLGEDTPVHFSRFYPMYKLLSLIATPVETLDNARKIAMETGLKYVYIGNVAGNTAEHTYCPKCGQIVIKRNGYFVEEINIQEGKCKFCGQQIEGVWNGLSDNVKLPNVAGAFYPDDPAQLSEMIDGFLRQADPQPIKGPVFALISPHAGYVFSGPTAAFGYKLIQGRNYKTVVVLGTGHVFGFKGISVYPQGNFRTPLGDLAVDQDLAAQLLGQDQMIFEQPQAFEKEHSLEVQLPFLQKVLTNFKIVPVVIGDCEFDTCNKFAQLLTTAIGKRNDVLIVASTDMYHGYDYQQTAAFDDRTISYIKNMDAQGLYNALRSGQCQLCGGFGVVATLIAAKKLGHDKAILLDYTDSAQVTGRQEKGAWTVGYCSFAIDQPNTEAAMLNKEQKDKLLKLSRKSIETYLQTGKKLKVEDNDKLLNVNMGAFVTLHKQGQLRGCIGNLVGSQPLYLTVRDMAVEAAVGDPRFPQVSLNELKDIKIDISALSPLEKVNSADQIKMGVHGVIVRKGYNSGVFLPQVATETGWSKEEFLSQLCSHKAGLPADAWKDKDTELYVFTAEVFSE